jgi:hypothetical protein
VRELNAVPRRYFSESPVRDDATNDRLTEEVPNPFAGMLPGTELNGETVARSQLLRPYPQFTSVTATETIGTSDYHALQARVERRFSSGFTVQAGYAWSRAMIAGATRNLSGFLNDFDDRPERVVSPFDRAHTFVSSGLLELPFGRRAGPRASGSGAWVGGWQVGYMFKAQSGAPLDFDNPLFAPGKGIDDVRSDHPMPDRWFNTDAFDRVPAHQLVSNVRTQPSRFTEVRGPGYAVLDLSVLKHIGLPGATELQLRLECYNVLNRVNLRDPNTTMTSSAFGTITLLNGLPRQLQIAARLSF